MESFDLNCEKVISFSTERDHKVNLSCHLTVEQFKIIQIKYLFNLAAIASKGSSVLLNTQQYR